MNIRFVSALLLLLASSTVAASSPTWDEYLDGSPGGMGFGQWWYQGSVGYLSSEDIGDGNWAYRMAPTNDYGQLRRVRWYDPPNGLTLSARFKAVSASGAQALRLQVMDGSYGRLQMEWLNGTWSVITGTGNSWAMPANTWTTIWLKLDPQTQNYTLWVKSGQAWQIASSGQAKTTADVVDLRFGCNATNQSAETWLDYWYVSRAGAFGPEDAGRPVVSDSLITNGNFENGTWGHPIWSGDSYVGDRWTPWSSPPLPGPNVDPVDPAFWHSPGNKLSTTIFPGNEFQRIVTYMDSWYAGIVQAVDTESSSDYDLEADLKVTGNFPFQVVANYGYDPTGQTADPRAPTIVWGPPGWVLDRDQWNHYHMRFTATGPSTSIWISGLKATREGAPAGAYLDIDNISVVKATEPLVNITEGPTARQLSESSFEISWKTDIASDSIVQYDPDQQNDDEGIKYDQETTQTSLTTEHSVVLTGLAPSQVYTYRVLSEAAGYKTSVSRNGTFETPGPAQAMFRNGGFEDINNLQEHVLDPWVPFTIYPNGEIDGLVGPYSSQGQSEWWDLVKANEGSYFLGSMSAYFIQGGGVYQRVQAQAGQSYQASFDYVTVAKAADASEQNPGLFGIGSAQWSDVQAWVGIDPNGGVDPLSPSIAWSQKWSENYRLFPTPEQNVGVWTDDFVTPAVTANSNAITVFVRLVQHFGLQVNMIAVDDVKLTGANVEPTDVGSIGAARQLPDFSYVQFTADSVCTLVPESESGVFYAQDVDGTAGIRVETAANTLPTQGQSVKNGSGSAWISTAGELVRLKGVIGTNPNGERVLRDATFTTNGQGSTPVRYSSNRGFGGASYVGSSGFGAENQGLLTMISGRVTKVDLTHFYFLLDDGSNVDPKLPGYTGVKVVDMVVPPTEGQFVAVMGVISAEKVNGQNIRVLKARKDITEMEIRNP